MLAFVGLGLYDRKDISVRGLELVREADFVFIESYTSVLGGADTSDLEAWYGREVRTVTREVIEVDPAEILALAEESRVVLLTGGDPMVSTTHTDLRMRACRKGIETTIIHGSSISTAVCGLSGLQNYRFGKSCSLPFRYGGWAPETPIDVIAGNLSRDLHTLVYLDISGDRCMTIPDAIEILGNLAKKRGIFLPLLVGIARAGSDCPTVVAGDAGKLSTADFGPPLHILIVPASLHVMEREYLEMFAGL
ncbi:MAG: diphthine synthase [Methanoregulaceae archaeon]|jgi:diphthine synthase|nr:diphthine synthase [Methanoregulaceae archaeon]